MFKRIISIIVISTFLLMGCNNNAIINDDTQVETNNSSEILLSKDSMETTGILDNKVKISEIHTNLELKDNWYVVPKDTSEITISVEAENVDLVLFWIAPTGTGTGLERELIGYDLDGSDGWSINWSFGDRIFHDHITIQVLGNDYATQAIQTINIHTLD